MGSSLARLMGAQRALRSRFDDFHRALKRGDRATLEVALIDFDENFRRWSLAEEQTLLPALARLALAGRDPQRELRLEYAQIREITALLRRRLAEGLRPADLFGFADNLDVRLAAHEAGMEGVYYPAADAILLPEEREALERACPEP